MERPSFILGIALLLIMVGTAGVSAQEYTVRSGFQNPPPPDAIPRTPAPVSFFDLPLWVILAQVALLPPELFLSIKLWVFLGFRRVSEENVLDQGVRAKIYEYIRKNPGIHLRGLAEEMDISMGTLRYHLNILKDTHKITLNEGVASVSFYENNGSYTPAEQHILKHLRNETTKKILKILITSPSSTRADIAHEIGVTGPSITWHMKRLEDDDILVTHREGRKISYEILPHIASYLSRRLTPL